MSIRNILARLFGVAEEPTTAEPPSTIEVSFSGILAEKVVNEYGRALQEASKFPLGAPESLLPHGKEVIADAIIEYTKIHYRVNELDAEAFDQLCIGYVELASFISDLQAHAGARAYAALSSDEVRGLGDETSEAMVRHQSFLAEKGERRTEFKEIMAQEGI